MTIIEALEAFIGVSVEDYGNILVWIAGAVVCITVYSVFRLIGSMFRR